MSLQFIRKDITKVKADAIVASVNSEPCVGLGVDRVIFEVSGYQQLLEERKKLGLLEVGQAGVTPAFHLQAKIVIHTVCPQWEDGKKEELDLLYQSYLSAFEMACKYNCESVAFPLLGTGTSKIPCDMAVQVAIDVIRRILKEKDITVYLVIKDDRSFLLPDYITTGNESCQEWKKRIGFQYNLLTHNSNENDYECRKKRKPSATVIGRLPITTLPPNMPPQFSLSKQTPPQTLSKMPPQFATQASPKMSHQSSEALPVDEIIHSSLLKGEKRDDISKNYRDTPVRIPDYKPRQTTLEEVLAQKSPTFQQILLRHIDLSGMSDVEVYRKANIDRKLFSKIRCNENYKPSKKTILALAIALELNILDTMDLLARAELAFSPCKTFDKVVRYYIENEMFDIYTINLMLFKLGLPMLGD